MWLSKTRIQQRPKVWATGGTVTMAGKTAAVIRETERRGVRVVSPGGYCWQPAPEDPVLVVGDDELSIVGMEQPPVSDMKAGEVRISSGKAAIYLKNDGRILLTGRVFVNGKELVMDAGE